MNALEFNFFLERGQAHFIAADYEAALSAYASASSLAPLETAPIAGLALTYHALGQKTQARRMWRILAAREPRYLDLRWLRMELHWPNALLAEAKQVIELI
ncbi:MAG: hypothetical protein R3E39_11375 [Anaerolineae bacterium]